MIQHVILPNPRERYHRDYSSKQTIVFVTQQTAT